MERKRNAGDLGKFIEDRVLSCGEDEEDAPELAISSNSHYAVFKTPLATINFYYSTKALQVQGKACNEMRNRLLDIFNLRRNSFQKRQDNGGEHAASPDDQNLEDEIAILIDLNTNEGALESLDCDVSDDAENEGDAEPDESVRRAEISKSNQHMALPDNREISSLKIEELKAIYSFIEIKVKYVCRLEIERLKLEASSSYSNETIASLREENNLLNERIQELESRYERVREEARSLSDENKSLMTVIRLLGKESQASTKEERITSTGIADNKDLHEKLQKLEFRHSILKQEDNSLREAKRTKVF